MTGLSAKLPTSNISRLNLITSTSCRRNLDSEIPYLSDVPSGLQFAHLWLYRLPIGIPVLLRAERAGHPNAVVNAARTVELQMTKEMDPTRLVSQALFNRLRYEANSSILHLLVDP